ncbi:MAG: flagellar hook-length control protein FliK [Ruminococcus sp.]|nr:flagellar hook-length control protein FliK [Ruminococcus sp.]
MAGIPVNNNLNALTNVVNRASAVVSSATYAKQEEALKDTFDMFMNRAGSQTVEGTDVQSAKADTKATPVQTLSSSVKTGSKTMSADVAATDNTAKTTVKSDNTDTKAVENAQKDETKVSGDTAEDKVSEEVPGEVQEEVNDASKKLVEDVAEELNVTPEEVEEALAVLGLSAMQLFDPENMKALLMQISGSEDQFALITDAELYGHLQNLLQLVSQSFDALAETLELPEDELNALLAQMTIVEEQPEETEIPAELLTKPEEAAEDDVNLEGMKDYAVTVHKDGETVEVKVTVNDADGSQSAQEEVKAAPEIQTRQESKQGHRNSSEEGGASGNAMMQTPVMQPQLQEVSEAQPLMERFVSTEDIMDQIMEYMKINVKEGMQELEMQLHPASLGNVNVQIASKDGVITAHFTAQNEIVKNAIETQLVQLKTQFEEQGIKVSEVEVTVADYRFEQNFSGNEEHPGEEQAEGKKNRRKIDLNELDLEELPEDMDDSERIAADMMARNGNTVDYMA